MSTNDDILIENINIIIDNEKLNWKKRKIFKNNFSSYKFITN